MATTAVMTSSAFLTIIRENKLVDEERLQACLRTVPPGALTGDDALPVADALVEQKLLTRFQANLLLQGKSKSLRITSKYRLLDRLGAGGMGLVYLCEHIRMKRLVALKVLPNAQSKEPGNLERFYREAQAVAALKHTNIVQAYDVDTDNGIHYLVMEYIDGINLEKLVTSHGALEPRRAAHYMAQAADGLQHAAERGLVHRDIKPSNLLIDREGYIKVLDMGLARFFDTRADTITERFDSTAVIGTADFISPEQALNSHDVDIRADIYSLGCTFYYLLTGRAPFHDANVTQKLLLHQIREPVPVEQFVPDIDPEMADVLRKMMAKKPDDRYQTPGEVVAALAPWTENAIAPPTELPASPQMGGMEAGAAGSTVSSPSITSKSKSKLAPKPSRGMMTERMTESAIRRMDGLPRKDEEEGGSSKLRWFIAGFSVLFAIGGLVFVAVKPWESAKKPVVVKSEPEDLPSNEFVVDANSLKKDVPKKDPPKKDPPPPKLQALGSGFVQVKMDAKTLRPSTPNGNVRATPTDVLLFSGPDLRKNNREEAAMLEVLRAQMVGGKGGPGTWTAPIVPYAVAIDGSKAPNTLVTVDDKGGLRPLTLGGKDYMVTRNFIGAGPEVNVLVRDGDAGLPKGMTTINALVSEYWDFFAAEGGSTLRVNSGALLFMSSTAQKSFAFGAGSYPLILDFNGKTGYLTLSSDGPDFTKIPGGREYIMRAQFANLNGNPLVVSGLSGTVLRLDNPANANAKLVIQGTQLDVKDKSFRVTFHTDANLGTAKGAVTIHDAALYMTPVATVEVDRPLTIIKSAQLSASNSKGQLRWAGKISGGKLSVAGGGHVILNRKDNDYNGGTEVWGGTLILAAEGGTPAGSGGMMVQSSGTLTGSGNILKDVVVRGGTLQPGSDDGKSLVLNGKLLFEKIAAKDKTPEKLPTARFRLSSATVRPLVYSQPPPLDLANARLQVELTGDFKPTADSKCVLITNRSGLRVLNHFKDAPQFGTVKTSDNKWTAKITYTGNAEKSTSDGGIDVMLYDFAAVGK